MSHKLQVIISEPLLLQLRELAANAGEPPSTLASQILRNGIALAAEDGKVRSVRSTPALVGVGDDGRAPWLEPYGGDPDWRTTMWGAVVALHGRYPRHLAHLNHGWWNDEAHTETLCALATWRNELDDNGTDPREELAFQHQLTDYSNLLRQESGGVTKTWKPDAPPEEWITGIAAR
jgi:hypothetical protein